MHFPNYITFQAAVLFINIEVLLKLNALEKDSWSVGKFEDFESNFRIKEY
jgi:hypothetical protein